MPPRRRANNSNKNNKTKKKKKKKQEKIGVVNHSDNDWIQQNFGQVMNGNAFASNPDDDDSSDSPPPLFDSALNDSSVNDEEDDSSGSSSKFDDDDLNDSPPPLIDKESQSSDDDDSSLPALLDPPNSDSSSSDEDYKYGASYNMRNSALELDFEDSSDGGGFFSTFKEASKMRRSQNGQGNNTITERKDTNSIEYGDTDYRPPPLYYSETDNENIGHSVRETYFNNEHEFFKEFHLPESVTDYTDGVLNFQKLSAFVKFPPLGHLAQSISQYRKYVEGGISDKATKEWAIQKLDYMKALEDTRVDETIGAHKMFIVADKSEREKKLKGYMELVPTNMKQMSTLRHVFHMEQNNEVSMDHIVERMHLEPAFYKRVQDKLNEDKRWRKSRVEKKCIRCNKVSNNRDGLKFCMSCFTVCYCNQSCQRAHWRYHSKKCELKGNITMITDYSDEPIENKLEHSTSLSIRLYDFLMSEIENPNKNERLEGMDFSDVLVKLFDTSLNERSWLRLPDTKSAKILQYIFRDKEVLLDAATQVWFKLVSEEILSVACELMRRNDMTVLILSDVPVRPSLVLSLFNSANQQNEFMNKFCSGLKVITLDNKSESALLLKASLGKLSKKARKNFLDALNLGEKTISQRKKHTVVSISRKQSVNTKSNFHLMNQNIPKVKKKVLTIPQYRKDFCVKFDEMIKWYEKHLQEIRNDAENGKFMKLTNLLKNVRIEENDAVQNFRVENKKGMFHNSSLESNQINSSAVLSDMEIASEMQRCLEVQNEEEQDEIVERVSSGISLGDWGINGEEELWMVEITESAHKWFKKSIKKSKMLVIRVLGRLKLLSSGRWPYVLKKPLKTRNGNVRLYESKIDSGSRIIWEIAITFSPRRSTQDESFCEQVVRVWDIVEDHDNLTRAIDLVVDRVERSHKRGEECMIYSELDSSLIRSSSYAASNVPTLFRMESGMKTRVSNKEKVDGRIFTPVASHDDQQYTLLKFYSLNTTAVMQLLRANDNKLPFTPGPKEYEIIQHKSTPPRPILLMGRSGTGKTTCLVFRMWSQYMAYANAIDHRPRQLFLTKSNVLKSEVKRAFLGMGSLFTKKIGGTSGNRESFPHFFSSSEWLDLLDVMLPGARFFSPVEIEKRASNTTDNKFVSKMVASLGNGGTNALCRNELTYERFRKLWKRLNSRARCDYDPALVYIEIKSYIKGSVIALHLEEPDFPARNYLSREEYINLPRKMSRIGRPQRDVIYDLFERYEQLKKEGNYYDEMDLVFSLAHRANRFNKANFVGATANSQTLQLPIDSCFVDEVQDFTQAELFLLVKLSRDPNNLMLAGDTAQSIAVGVGFRFVDVRQIFYEHFNCIEPDLLQLVHNYRTHAGVLRLAACVVELLYFFFSDSLDAMPPDQGLFNGPKPVIVEVTDPTELVILMNGGKEGSRIEFGAHQVILVRNDEAKSKIPEEFVSDKDWILTVQEAKGLEFDDVLVYNFFTDSDAHDEWRVVSNYTENDVNDFYKRCCSDALGKRSYEWHELEEMKSTRYLDFQDEAHKVLESELKILYTAITRARVNVYIAEENMKQSKPMFNYFLHRGVVNMVDTNTKDSLATINVFGKSNDTPEEWIRRGDMFLRHAESTRKRSHLLRLASKCFCKGGDNDRETKVLADLAYAELEEDRSKNLYDNKRKAAHVQDKKIYDVALKLIATHDEALLTKAAKCIVQVGELEKMRSAKVFELSAKLMYAKRQLSSIEDAMDIDHIVCDESEQQNFRFAAHLLIQCLSDEHENNINRKELILQAVKNLLASSKEVDLNHVNDILLKYTPDVFYLSSELGKWLKPKREIFDYKATDPMRNFYALLKQPKVNNSFEVLKNTMNTTIEKACIFFYESNQTNEFQLAFDAVSPDDKQRIYKRLGLPD